MKIRINISAMVITLLSCSIVTVALVGGNVDAATIETSPTISEPQLINPPPNGCAVKAGYPHLSTYWKKLGQYKVDTHALIDCTDPQQKIEVTATLQAGQAGYNFGYYTVDTSETAVATNASQVESEQAKAGCTYGLYAWWQALAVGYFYENGQSSGPVDGTPQKQDVACF